MDADSEGRAVWVNDGRQSPPLTDEDRLRECGAHSVSNTRLKLFMAPALGKTNFNVLHVKLLRGEAY